MRFESFLTALERDLVQTKVVTMCKGTDSTARPLIQVKNPSGVVLLEIMYSEDGYGKASRVLNLLSTDGSKCVICSSGVVMATNIMSYLRVYTQLPNATMELKKSGILV